MQVAINPKHDPKKLAKEFAKEGRLQIRDFFTDDFAEGMWRIITEKTPWAFTFITEDGAHLMTGPEFSEMLDRRRRELWAEIYQRARHETQYLYFQFPIEPENEKPNAKMADLYRFREWLNTDEALDFVRALTGEKSLDQADAQADWYRRDHFRTEYAAIEGEGAPLIGFEFNFTKDWKRDWGGFLQFYDADGDVTHGFMPRFNALTVFRADQPRAVTFVAPYSDGWRVAITGSFRPK